MDADSEVFDFMASLIDQQQSLIDQQIRFMEIQNKALQLAIYPRVIFPGGKIEQNYN